MANWYQGAILSDEAVTALQVRQPADGVWFAVVITHSCDLQTAHREHAADVANTKRKITEIELLWAEATSRPDPQLNGRGVFQLTLQLDWSPSPHEQTTHLVLRRRYHEKIPVDLFFSYATPHPSASLDKADRRRRLPHWIAKYYARPAFPDEFVRRLKESGDVLTRLRKILKPHADVIDKLRIDLGDTRYEELTDDESYDVAILITHADTCTDTWRLTSIKREVEAIFRAGTTTEPKSWDLLDCRCLATGAITLHEVATFDEFDFEDLSF